MTKTAQQSTDKELLHLMERRENTAFRIFYLRYRSLVKKRIYAYIRRRELAEDVAQEFWIRIWENPQTMKTNEKGSAFCYLYSMLSSICQKASAKQKQREKNFITHDNTLMEWDIIDESPTIEELIEFRELKACLKQCYQSLSFREQQVLYFYLANFTATETAHRLHLSASGVYQRLHRSIEQLQETWRKHKAQAFMPE